MLRKLFIAITLFISLQSSAQLICATNSIAEAEAFYNIGRFRECINILQNCMAKNSFAYSEKLDAHRLLSMSYLAIDSVERAESNIQQLLQIRDDYSADTRDPERFKTTLEKVRALMRVNLVSSVSKKAEDIRKAPATIIVVTQQEIIQRGYLDLVELIQDLPGFEVANGYGVNYTTIYQRGLRTTTTEKTLLLIDGVEENDLWSNTADLSRQYPLTNIKRVEVIYGPASTMYGSNAFTGVINIITKEPEEIAKVGRNFGVNISGGYGSFNTRYADVTTAYKKDLFAVSVNARFYESDRHDLSSQRFFDYDPAVYDGINYKTLMNIRTGAQAYIAANSLPASSPYYTIFGPTGNADSIILTDAGQAYARTLDKGAYNATVLGKRVGYSNPSKNVFLSSKISVGSFTIGMQTMHRQEAAGTLYTDQFADMNNVYWIPQRSYVYMKYERKLSNKLMFSSFSNYRNHGLDNNTRVASVSNYARRNLGIRDLVRNVAPVYNTTYFYQTNKQFRSELKFLYTPTQNLYVVAGVEYRNSQLQGNYLNTTNIPNPEELGTFTGAAAGGNQFNVNDIGVYAQASYRYKEHWGFTGGLRVDKNVIRQNGGYGDEYNPRFVIDYVKKDWVVKAIYSRGIMNVSNFTKFSTAGGRIPNPNLKTESIENFEFYISKKINKQLTFDVSVYESFVEDVVAVKVLSATTSQNQNLGAFKIFGLQSNINYNIKNGSLILNYSYTDPKQTKDDNGNNVSLRVGDIATHHVNIIGNYLFFNKLNLNIRTNILSSKKTGVGTSVPANPETFPGYFISNGTISLVNMVKNATLQLICNNIFDRRYFHPGARAADGISTPSSILQPERNFFIRFNYDF